MSAAASSPAARRSRSVAGAVAGAAAMADGLLEGRSPSVARRLSARGLRAELTMSLTFAASAAAMVLVLPPAPAFDPVMAVLLVATYALVARVKFQLGPGFVQPTQLVFVPMLFLLGASSVPLLVAAAVMISRLPEILRRRAHPERLLVAVA